MTKNKTLLISILSTLVLLGGVYGLLYVLPTQNASDVENDPAMLGVHYFCSDAKTLSAVYEEKKVTVTFDSGRTISLPMAVSGSGVRYEVQDEITAENIVFWSKGDSAFVTENEITIYEDCISGDVLKIGGGLTFTATSNKFAVTYPEDAFLSGGGIGFTNSWMNMSTSSGLVLAKITLPKSSYPMTNFSEGVFTIGTSADASALVECATGKKSDAAKGESVTIEGIPYTKFVFVDAGAGNFYETTSYRMVMQGQCYALEYTIHTTNIGNYSPEQGIKEYDSQKVHDIFEKMVASVKFAGAH